MFPFPQSFEQDKPVYDANKNHEFVGAKRFLSNFYPVNVELDAQRFSSVEHAYQAAKTLDLTLRLLIQNIPANEPGRAKSYGSKVPLREGWESMKVEVMKNLLRQKFSPQNPVLLNALLETGNEQLVEYNYWKDKFWGVYKGKGENMLGKLLMEIRASYKEK